MKHLAMKSKLWLVGLLILFTIIQLSCNLGIDGNYAIIQYDGHYSAIQDCWIFYNAKLHQPPLDGRIGGVYIKTENSDFTMYIRPAVDYIKFRDGDDPMLMLDLLGVKDEEDRLRCNTMDLQ